MNENGKRSFDGIWIPADLWLFEKMKPVEKILYKEIKSLDNGIGCTARNKYFAGFLKCSEAYVRKMITKFINEGWISRTLIYKEESKEVDYRILNVVKEPVSNRELPKKTFSQESKNDAIFDHEKMIKIDHEKLKELLNYPPHPGTPPPAPGYTTPPHPGSKYINTLLNNQYISINNTLEMLANCLNELQAINQRQPGNEVANGEPNNLTLPLNNQKNKNSAEQSEAAILPSDAEKKSKPTKAEQREIDRGRIIKYLNFVLQKKRPFSSKSKIAIKNINARFKEGYTTKDFKKVIDVMAHKWCNNSEMKQYLVPDTLFSGKFEKYLRYWDDWKAEQVSETTTTQSDRWDNGEESEADRMVRERMAALENQTAF